MEWWIWILVAVPWTPIMLILLLILKKLRKIEKSKNETFLYIVEDKDDGPRKGDKWH